MSKGIKTDAHAGATGAAAPEVRAPRGILRVDARKRLPVAGRDDPVGPVHGREGEHLTSGLFAAYPDAPSLAAADVRKVEALMRSTGFFATKARNLIGRPRGVMDC